MLAGYTWDAVEWGLCASISGPAPLNSMRFFCTKRSGCLGLNCLCCSSSVLCLLLRSLVSLAPILLRFLTSFAWFAIILAVNMVEGWLQALLRPLPRQFLIRFCIHILASFLVLPAFAALQLALVLRSF